MGIPSGRHSESMKLRSLSQASGRAGSALLSGHRLLCLCQVAGKRLLLASPTASDREDPSCSLGAVSSGNREGEAAK